MDKYIDIILQGYKNYANFLCTQMLHPAWNNYFYWIVASSVALFFIEKWFPWRKDQPALREDFWLDTFYIFWNYFLFSLVAYHAFSEVFVQLFKDFLAIFGIRNLVAIRLGGLDTWAQLLIIFVVRDFLQYNIHRLFHHVPLFWRFHKVHHSTEEMGYGALMRYHFLEQVLYRALEYLPLAMLGFGIQNFFIVHMFTFITGQLGHANLYLPMGRMKYLLNGPQMHLWHHAKAFPAEHPQGMNYGITLSVWDYLFKTVYHPHDDPHLTVGLPESEKVADTFLAQQIDFFRKK
jgi:sterol desaturase/sphingolipid hydroxylase (fatty acid hydroxylase superfamily)